MLKKDELKEISGGGFSISLGVILGGVLTFFIGVFDGYTRPLACHK